MSVAFRIELNGVISPSAPGLVHSYVKLMAVKGEQVGADRTSLRWWSYPAEQFFMWYGQLGLVRSGGAKRPSLSPLRYGERALA